MSFLHLKSNVTVLTQNTPKGRRALRHLHSSSVRGLKLILLGQIIHSGLLEVEIIIITKDQVTVIC